MMRKGPGDYLVAAPTFKLLERAAVPYLQDAFETKLELGKLVGGAYGMFRISPKGEMKLFGKRNRTTPTRILFGHADNPESLEAAQYKAAWLDECGQAQFKQASWEAIQRRLAIDQGRALMTTTPYFSTGWLKEQVYDRWKRAKFCKENNLPVSQWDEEFDVINFESIDNPAFPIEEWDRLRESLPPWKFSLFCRGIFTRPAGAVFDCWDSDTMTDVENFVPPPEWPRYVGVDFGYPNFAAVYICEEMVDVADLPNAGTIKVTIKPSVDENGKPVQPVVQKAQSRLVSTGRYRVYKEYRPTESKQTREHVKSMIRGEPRLPEYCCGGAPGETVWRDQFAADGYPIAEPDQSDREVGIDRIYAMIAENRLIVHKSCPRLIDELENMSRIVDDNGNVLDDIDDEGAFHGIASLRYICSWLRRVSQKVDIYF